jgi:hypothetical protein
LVDEAKPFSDLVSTLGEHNVRNTIWSWCLVGLELSELCLYLLLGDFPHT